MKRSTFSDSQILSILKQHEAGVPVSELAREYGVSTALMRRLTELEAENARLKKNQMTLTPLNTIDHSL